MIYCCVGIMAYNEEANIGRLLEALLKQTSKTVVIQEIFVIASGCTDHTEQVVEEFAAKDARINLIRQAKREGKASAVNLLLHHTNNEIIVLESADTLPLEDTIERLVSPLKDPKIGMVGGHPVPTNVPTSFMGYSAYFLWELHHQVSMHSPKMGELIAFRKIFQQIPANSITDEASIEPLITGQGLSLHYAPDAIVLNKGPETLGDFFRQRRRIFVGHLHIKDTLGYQVSTMNIFRIIWLFFKDLKWDWRYFIWGSATGGLELLARLLGTYDYIIRKRRPYMWIIAESTKDLAEV